MRIISIVVFMLYITSMLYAQNDNTKGKLYKKRVLEATEIDFLSSYYIQDGSNASVSGGIGTEELTNFVGNVIISIPLSDDDILSIDASISSYTSASSSNLNPFDGPNPADPFVASSGASKSDALASLSTSYTHHSDDRNTIWSLIGAVATEYDYTSLGFGGRFTRLFNDKNSEISLSTNIYLDSWKLLYPYELGGPGGDPDDGEWPPFDIGDYPITGNPDYQPKFTPYTSSRRNTYAFGLSYSQILSKRAQVLLMLDVTQQSGVLSN
ncbi:MAG: DUF3570 domain-containing protein, partial [Bacteroidales bacterium]|nr:DUF3570 domain-containing protein [Bacteroidales bacterium]